MPKILVIEDELHILRLLSLWLTRHGYEVLEATTGEMALERLRGETIDAVICDMNLPGVDGLTVIRIARTELKLAIPILLLTARCDQENLIERLKPYRVRLFPKPFVPSQIVAEIDALLKTQTVSG